MTEGTTGAASPETSPVEPAPTPRTPISMSETEFNTKGRFERMKLATQENMGSSSLFMKGMRVLGTAAGAWYVAKGV